MHKASPGRVLGALAAALLAGACGFSTPPAAAQTPDLSKPFGYATNILAQGTMSTLPAGVIYANVIDLPQDSGGSITHAHVAGFVYGVAGVHSMPIDGGATQTVNPGEAAFIGAGVKHSHINPGQSPNDWYFISLRPTAARSAPSIVPGQKVLYATEDLNTPLAPGAYSEQLDRLVIAPGGRGAPLSHAGFEMDYVLSGSLIIHGEGGTAKTVHVGEGFVRLPGTATQDYAGSAGVTYLAFFATLEGQPFETELGRPL